MFFHSWADVGRAVLTTAIVFALIVAILRVVGAQAIARMSGYDMVATVTFGSVVATVGVTRGVAISEGIAALLTLVALQETIRFFQSRWLPAHHAVRQPPLVLVWEGALLEGRLRRSRISADEVRAAVRKMGLASLADARLVVLENDGEWSVVPCSAHRGDDSALHGLPIPGRPGNTPAEEGAEAEAGDPFRVP
ncbi:MAG TPA: YetF domain-containing protein [Longimicrobium sp.]|jgi:uncharacterized membrane protein YcaP (DUF421 family)|nr:YetF domain-containing protein [Longimicrobium sp.]